MKLNEQLFVDYFEALQRDAAGINCKNGFTSDDLLLSEFEGWFVDTAGQFTRERFDPLFKSLKNARTGLKLALVMGELGETLEAVRKNLGPDSHIPEFTSEEAEVADVVIRLMNYATDRKLRLAAAIVAKNEYNRDREDHSKSARQTAHGKKF